MDFALKAFLSFIVGGSFVSIIVWLSEQSGSSFGGAIAGVPQTILISLASICITEGAAAAKTSSRVIPVILLASLLYAYIFISASRQKIKRNKPLNATLVSILVWFIAAIAIHLLFSKANILLTAAVGVLGIVAAHFIFSNWSYAKPKKIDLPNHIYITRFFISGSVVLGAVLTARLLGPLWGGIISGFPATFSTSLYFLNSSQGNKFTEGFAKRLPLSILSSLVFAVILNLTITKIHPLYSFGLGISGSLVYTYSLMILTKPKLVEQIS